MADDKAQTELHEYAGGWMTERKGTDLPPFLKFALPLIGLGCLGYLLLFMNGEVSNPSRGRLVQQFNAATQSSSAFMYAVALLILIFLVILGRFIFGGSQHED